MQDGTAVFLLVEDNLEHAELVMRLLGEQHLVRCIHHVTDGEAALDYLYRREQFTHLADTPLPQLILLDLRLPKIDGLEVLRTIKADMQLRQIPVVILTSSASERDLLQAYDNFVNSYLVKPIDFSAFSQLLKDLGYYWQVWNRNSIP